ncbi:BTAD domain-containing putative transcriptional regulator [Mycobacterium sp. E740]|uniref:BTAD domain-containing putative transcriptional regulator n=1 Tax=Mycobacterium sp. E740 TaxID=1834149 RepID=UPI001E38554B|nr:BTAD domain-containing putative transcriptional regulator [Mycobacterium sp. E740]
MLGLHGGSVVSADTLVGLLWGDDPPRTAAKALPTHISTLRRNLGDGFVLTEGAGWKLSTTAIDAVRYKAAVRLGRDALDAGDPIQALARFEEAGELWRGCPELPDAPRGLSEKTRWIEGHAALVEDRADALLATGRAAEIIGELEAAVADAPLRERRWGQLMLALYRAGRQGEALAAYQRARSLLADELGIDPGPDLRRLEAAIVAQDSALEVPVSEHLSVVTRAVTFLLTDIEGSTVAWENNAVAMSVALARHDELVEQVVTSRGGRLIKTRGEGDATFSVFDRPSGAATAAIELQEAIRHEPWALQDPMRIRVALHTGEVELRDGDYFGRAVNRAARLRSLAVGGQILCSGATAELVIDSLPDDVVLADLGTRQLKNLARPEHVFELHLQTAEDAHAPATDAPSIERPDLPAVLAGTGPFVGRLRELEGLLSAWQTALATGTHAVLISGEPGVGKTRLAGEWARQAYESGAMVLYGRCDEDLGAPYQPFSESLRSLVPCLGTERLRGLRGIKALLPLIPGLADDLPELVGPTHADADSERYALFDAVVALLEVVCANAPVVVILDDLHWAAKPTLLLLRHVLRFGEHTPVQIVGTYRSTDLDRTHPLAAMLADLHRDGSADRLALSGLDENDISTYVAEAGYDDEELARALASVTGGNPFFLIEALRHVEESGGRWDPRTLPQGVREAVSRRLSRLSEETNSALAAAAVVGSRFSLELVERVTGDDLVDPFDQACKAGIVIEEPGGRYRFNHALVRQSLLAELPSVRRMRLHQRIATTLEAEPGADDELLAELAYHYFECAWAGNAAKAVEYCQRAADQAMSRLAYEGAADLYDRALHALDELDDELSNRDDRQAELLIARCEALLAAGDVVSAVRAVSALRAATRGSARLAAWGTCFDGQLSMLTDPERLDEIESAVSAAAEKLAELEDIPGEAKGHTVRAACLARLGRIGDAETALDQALTAARRAHEHRRVNNVLANAPLAALWGPNPVPRAGGRCLDVVRLLRITTGSPVVEATSTRCQGVLDAFRGRAAAGRQLIDSARRTLTQLGMRHALLEVEQFAGIVELVADDPGAAEQHLRRAYNGFRRMGLDADTAETAALLARACLALDRDADADELCAESERLAGHAFKAAIAWRTVRAHLLARRGDHKEARRTAEEAVAIAERTDALVDHGDACLALATVLNIAGDAAGAQAAAEKAVGLYELKGAAALAEMARGLLGPARLSVTPATPEASQLELDNECMRVAKRAMAAINREALDEAERLWAADVKLESRRKIVRFEKSDLPPDEWYARRALQVGGVRVSGVVIAIRGERLALTRTAIGTTDTSPGAPSDEFLRVFGIDQQGRIALEVWFDVDDVDAAVAELDAQHARFDRDQPLPPTEEPENDCVRVIDRLEVAWQSEAWLEAETLVAPSIRVENRRKIVGITSGWLSAAEWISQARQFREAGMQRYRSSVVAVRGERLALNRLQVGTVDVSAGAPQDEMLIIYGIDDRGLVALQLSFDIDDIDAATAELDALHAQLEPPLRPRPPLANTASRSEQRLNALFVERRWDEIEAMITEDAVTEERRRGFRRESSDRATLLEECRVVADLGVKNMTSEVIAIRGERLVLSRVTFSGRDRRSDAFHTDLLRIAEMSEDERLVRVVTFDLDDLDAAFAELDARYLADEAAFHAETWSVIASSYAAFNRHEIPAGDWLTIDHRRETPFEPSNMTPSIHTIWDLTPDLTIHIEAVHQLNSFGAVITHIGHGTSQEGFDAEWRAIDLLIVDSGLIDRCEVFDETDLDAALARLDEISCRTPHLENTATRIYENWLASFAARDWNGMAGLMAVGIFNDDRRRVVNGGIQSGRQSVITNMKAVADVGVTNIEFFVMATRGDRLALARQRVSGEKRPEAFGIEVLMVVEVDADNRFAAGVAFDVDDIDAAFAELDARYLAGEAAAYANTWSVIADATAAFQRHEMPPTTADWINADHRHWAAFAPGDFFAFIRAASDVAPNMRRYIEAVHRLSNLGAVVTGVANGNSHKGFQAEWRTIVVATVDGDLVSRNELFEEADLDIALARFDELSRSGPRLENAASRVCERYRESFAVQDWDEAAVLLTDDLHNEDRRQVVNAGIRHGRDSALADLRAAASLGIPYFTGILIATRGEHLVLYRGGAPYDERPGAFRVDLLQVAEIDADERIAAIVAFDPDDVDAAFAELDSRYLVGEAAPYAHTWSVIARNFAAFNRHEFPSTTPDWVTVDHRRARSVQAGDLPAFIRSTWHDIPDATVLIETVHRLSERGVVITQVTKGTSREGFEAEWREINLSTVDGELINRCELYDEEDLDAALARFDELTRVVPRVENAASRADDRFFAYFAARDWVALADALAGDCLVEDRRRLVNVGRWVGRDAVVTNLQALAEAGPTMTSTIIATRGERLALFRIRSSRPDKRRWEVGSEMLHLVEIDIGERIVAHVEWEHDDIDAAFAELESRYLAGEAAACSQSWQVIVKSYAAVNRGELPSMTADWVNVDHRRGTPFVPGEMTEIISTVRSVTPDLRSHIETVHRLSSYGALFTQYSTGSAADGFHAEWRMINLVTIDGDSMNRLEVFDEEDLDIALAKFEELSRPRLENTASHVYQRLLMRFLADDWDAMADLLADDFLQDDRRRVVGAGARHGRDAQIEDMRAIAGLGFRHWTPDAIATRGMRLFLRRVRYSDSERADAVHIDVLEVVEIDADERLAALVIFDTDDVDAAFAELDARYLAAEAATHADMWSFVTQTYAGFNRRELVKPAPNWGSVDHRRGIASAQFDPISYAHAAWDVTPNAKAYVESVHRLSDHGAVVTAVTHGTSQEGFDAEWRDIHLTMVEGSLGKHFELFDEADLDAALARFDELEASTPGR